MAFLVSGIPMTLKSYELLMIKPEIPHAIQGGEDMIEHFGIRALYLDDKQILDRALMKANLQFEDQRLFSGSWGHHIPLNLDQHKNCWLIGAGSARFHSQHMIMAYLDFPTFSSANAGIGTRHRLHLHRKSWEYYTVLEGTKTLQIENQLVTVEAGHILEVPPEVKHVLHSRTAPFKGFTIRVPVALNDKIEI
jgi:mannose-6-phosphate isomerase-like protein (cupin superfamily)